MPIQNKTKTFSSNTYTFISLQQTQKSLRYNSTPPANSKKITALILKTAKPLEKYFKYNCSNQRTQFSAQQRQTQNFPKIQQLALDFIKKNIAKGLKASCTPILPPFF